MTNHFTNYTNSSQLTTLVQEIIERTTGTALDRTMSQHAITEALGALKRALDQVLQSSFYNDPKIQLLLNEAAEGKKMIVDALNEKGQNLSYDTPYLHISQIIKQL